MTTRYAQTKELKGEWYLLDASDRVLGRLASGVAAMLRGKHKPSFSPHQDCGDFVVVLNAGKVRLSGNKAKAKEYYRYSTRPGHKKKLSYEQLSEKKPGEALRLAVKGMLPKNHLGRKMLSKLKIYSGNAHPHQAQNPSPLSFDARGGLVPPKGSAVSKAGQAKEEKQPAPAKTEAAVPKAKAAGAGENKDKALKSGPGKES